ncbi:MULTISPECIES: lipocalin-like domain-containing protein [Acidithiobacillus]|uniref:Hydrolase n=2 Tax=Acidithiobacillus TaxID=119977 RepID=A0A179BK19_ACIFR|nr:MULTISPECIES: lipocalin-like domain-containing protein [Acidithiobacillus]MDA8182610.1 carotenoid 1,2-hydratase [Acidithiobacillus sp.]MBU2853682.1 carotenoid 1,2-hydratase [Acidithiobacillus ferriphilus]MEB8488296.1 carotenoid 1,2-hydratase [Acidithiobacillus ferriphilus]MEB8489835.1 carotenoid 1,2-hydratase [Acidithiobacillus ferriphilus]MEB8494298.1 carotenoid 1,2-hydratase [Acidithiobacillus ferriphilus]
MISHLRSALPRKRICSGLLVLCCGLCGPAQAASSLPGTPLPLQPTPDVKVTPQYPMQFPNALGSHPDFPIEWWYVTGWLQSASEKPLGFQITFFRVRPPKVWANPSAFNPRELLFAEAALSDPRIGHLLTAQRAARAGLGLAGADQDHTNVWIRHWYLRQRGRDYEARINGNKIRYRLQFTPTQPALPEGPQGISQKGPDPKNASYYYSLPHLKVSGTVAIKGQQEQVRGEAWLDHEWSAAYLPKKAVGWDWLGINLQDGGALMVFMMRRADGAPFWLAATERNAQGHVHDIPAKDIRMQSTDWWRSPQTGTRYPVRWQIQVGSLHFAIVPLMDNQEFDASRSSGTVYWEGAVRAMMGRQIVGKGYLELTGYGGRLALDQ